MPPLRLFDLFSAGEQGVEVAIFGDQRRRGLDANPGRARNIVDAISGKRLNIDDFIGADAKLFDHLLMPDMLVLHRVEHGDLVRDKLHQVLVRRDDGHSRTLRLGLTRIGRHQIVSLIPFQLQGVRVESNRRFAHQRELRSQILRWFRPVGLVFREHLISERVGRLVEHTGKMRRPLVALEIFEQLPQHVAEAGHGADRQSIRRAGQRRQGVIGAKDVSTRIDQVEMAVRIDRRARHGSYPLLRHEY